MFRTSHAQCVEALGDDGIGIIGGGTAVADRQSQSQPKTVDRKTESEKLIESVAKSARNRVNYGAGGAVTGEYILSLCERAAPSSCAVLTGQPEIRPQAICGRLNIQIVNIDILPGSLHIWTQTDGLLHNGLSVHLDVGRRFDGFGQHKRQPANGGIEIGAHLFAQDVLHLLQAVSGLRKLNLIVGKLRLWLIDIQRRDCAQFQFPLRPFQRSVGQSQRLFLYLYVFTRQNHIPVCILRIGDKLENLVLQEVPGGAQPASGDGDGQFGEIRSAIAEQRLRKIGVQVGADGRIEQLERTVGGRFQGTESHVILRAGAEDLRPLEVRRLAEGIQGRGTGKHIVGGRLCPRGIEASGDQRIEHGKGTQDAVPKDLHRQFLNADVGVVRHYRIEIRSEREFQLVVRHIVGQEYRRPQFHIRSGLIERRSEIVGRREDRRRFGQLRLLYPHGTRRDGVDNGILAGSAECAQQ